MTQNTAEKLFDDVSKFIDESRAILKQGDELLLGGLDVEVQRLCDAVLHLSQDDRLKYADKLQCLLADLSTLGEEMAGRRDEVAGQIHNLSSHRQANVAYRTADSTEDLKKQDDS